MDGKGIDWISIVDEGRKKKIKNKIEEIIDVLIKENKYNNRSGLMSGEIGVILFLFYCSKTFNNHKLYNYSFKRLSEFLKSLPEKLEDYAFADGLAGICWGIIHLSNNFLVNQKLDEIISNEVDEIMFEALQFFNEKLYTDFFAGGAGIAYYFIIKNEDNASKYLDYFVNRLEELSIYDKESNGIKWESEKDENVRKFDLGIAHGIAGTIEILRLIMLKNVSTSKTKNLLEQAINFLSKQKLDPKEHFSIYPDFITPSINPSSSRLGWCYGDLGIGIILHKASISLGNSELLKYANSIIEVTTMRRSLENTKVNGAGLCHGSSGIAHIYNRIYNIEKNEKFKESALYWLDKTLEFGQNLDNLAGFKNFVPDNLNHQYCFLTGISGIGLSLLGFISEYEPKWDDCLLLS